MVRKKSILKDALREIKFNKKRFFSILLIIILGVGFYAGLKSAALDMEKTAKQYYKDTNLFDLKLVSTTGFSNEDKNTLKNMDGIKGVSLSKTLDATTTIKNKDYVIRLNSINKDRSIKSDDYINRLILTNGRYPSTINEGLVEESFLKDNNLVIGDLITLKPEDNNYLRAKKIKIVGTIKSSYYSSLNGEISTLKDGKIDYYIYLEENDFNMEYYNEGFVTLNDAYKYDAYKDNYEFYVKKNKDNINKFIIESTNAKYESNINLINSEISSLEEKLNELTLSPVPQESLTDEIKEITNNLEKAKERQSKIKIPSAYSLSRNEIPSFYEYKLETERIKNISKVFPLIFLIVATLISLTSITKIIDEEKKQIGTLRAIGYSKFDVMFKYVLYAVLASLLGSIVGSLLFSKIIPMIISACYKSFYDMPSLITTFQIKHALFASLFTLLASVLATIFTFIKYEKETPAVLMKTKIVNKEKNRSSKKINRLYNKFNILNKVAIKNTFMYKKRLIITIIGVCGCTALILTAFGLKDSVNKIVNKQFEKINVYDMIIGINNNLKEDELINLEDKIKSNDKINDVMAISKTKIEVKNKESKENAFLIIPENDKKINKFITLKNNNKKLTLKKDNIIISEKLAKLLNVNKNDVITLTTNENKEIKLKINGITKNYIDHYVYMSLETYESMMEKEVNFNNIITLNKKGNDPSSKISDYNNVTSVLLTSDISKNYKDMMGTLKYVTLILIVTTSLLTFVVFYNLSSNNLSERKKELSTMKVLGFYDEEIINHIHKETFILTIIGSLLGLLIGSFLSYYVIKICETEMFMFSFEANVISYILSFLITLVMLLLVNIFMYFNLKKLNEIKILRNYE